MLHDGTQGTPQPAETLRAHLIALGLDVYRIDENAVQSDFTLDGHRLTVFARVEHPYLYIRLFPFPGHTLPATTDYLALLHLNDEYAVIKASIDRDQCLVVSYECVGTAEAFDEAFSNLMIFIGVEYAHLAAIAAYATQPSASLLSNE